MTHDEAQALWLLDNDGALGAAEQQALRQHLQGCAACQAAVDRMAATDRELRAWGSAAVPPSVAGPVAPATAPRPWIPVALAAALAGITLGSVGGYVAGQRSAEPAPPAIASTDARTTFVLLLEEPASQWPPAAPLARPGYFEWMDSLVANGLYEDGVRLAEDEGWYLGTGGSQAPAGSRSASAANYSGMFVIRARDYDEAVSIARTSPHLQYGGILVRRTY